MQNTPFGNVYQILSKATVEIPWYLRLLPEHARRTVTSHKMSHFIDALTVKEAGQRTGQLGTLLIHGMEYCIPGCCFKNSLSIMDNASKGNRKENRAIFKNIPPEIWPQVINTGFNTQLNWMCPPCCCLVVWKWFSCCLVEKCCYPAMNNVYEKKPI